MTIKFQLDMPEHPIRIILDLFEELFLEFNKYLMYKNDSFDI